MFLIDVLRRKRQRLRRGPVRWFALERAGVRTPSVQLLPSGSPLASPSICSIQRAVTQDSHLGKAVNQRMPGHFLADAGIPARQGCLCGRGCVGTAEWDSGHWLLPHLSTAVDSHLGHIPETLMPGLSPDQAPFVEGLL